ncbi:flagellar biosynthesis anti-sigma factor FlgM [Kurthia sibirica]|uniref:Negative regulator of flagellin synthesis n=1 Tax=Kurthia sibirica TaxID=202750 RepID=A0A2U3AMM8_9BACL|nr:flagellar biosynthesis anti-sigma factor FlgM [Kurthia sibirica]PWI25788.1 flagellar biosynthesis anti-sigma factor FlgM [Kurthia sibirica]GEK35098.1 negative regulator of flagellin synthesis [Kurthia sibirica]
MKINNFGVNPINPYKNQQLKTEAAKKATMNFSDQLEISSQAKDLQGIKDFASTRVDKVNMIKKQIEAGTYQVDADRLANDLLKNFRP